MISSKVIRAGPQINRYEGYKAVPARPSGTVTLKVRLQDWEVKRGKLMASGLLAVCGRGKELSLWAEFCVWRASSGVTVLVTVGTD
jgi:hypothetical protein